MTKRLSETVEELEIELANLQGTNAGLIMIVRQLEAAIETRDEIINDLRRQLKLREINKVGELIEAQ